MRTLEVSVKKGEPVDRALKRLKGKLDSEGVMDEIRRLRAFETATERTQRKARQNARRNKANTGTRFRFTLGEKPAVEEGGAAGQE